MRRGYFHNADGIERLFLSADELARRRWESELAELLDPDGEGWSTYYDASLTEV